MKTRVNYDPQLWPWPLTLKFDSVLEVVVIHVHAKFHKAKCSGSWVIVSTNFFPLTRETKWWKIRKSGPVTLTFDSGPWNSLGFERLSGNTFTQNFIELSVAVHELSWWQRKKHKQYCPSLPQTVKIIRLINVDDTIWGSVRMTDE